MNKQIFIVGLLVMAFGLQAAEQKNDLTEGELLFSALQKYPEVSEQEIQRIWDCTPQQESSTQRHNAFYEIALPQAIEPRPGIVITPNKKAIVTLNNCCKYCPRMKVFKLPVNREDDSITYVQMVLLSVSHQGKTASTFAWSKMQSPDYVYTSPFVIRPGVSITSPLKAHVGAPACEKKP